MNDDRTSGAPFTIALVQTPHDLEVFTALLAEYNESLPASLRRDLTTDIVNLGLHPGMADAAFLGIVALTAAGSMVVKRIDAETAVMMRMYVRLRFRRRGYASAFVDEARAWAKAHGCRRIVLDTDKELLPAAYALYTALGFRPCDPYPGADYATPTYLELPL